MTTDIADNASFARDLEDAPNAMRGGPLAPTVVDEARWERINRSSEANGWTLLSLWGEPECVHVALADLDAGDARVLTLPCPDGSYPSVGRHRPPAIRLERAIADLFGLVARDAPDMRAWLDHGRWDVTHPLGRRKAGVVPAPYTFLPALGEALHQIPVGPVHAGIIEPGHFRFTATGETIVRLEERLGYVHKGIDGLIAGADIAPAARIAARTSGDSTVAYSIAFARAIEAALGVEVTRRTATVRAIMGELERIANHLGDFGAICNDASFSILHAHCGILREHVLRAAAAAFGHRLMMDVVQPGGVRTDIDAAGATAIRIVIAEIRTQLPALVDLYDNTASLQDRTAGTGILTTALAHRFGAGGYVARAAGRRVDARRNWAYPPYDRLSFEVPVLDTGDVDARVWVRIHEIEASLSLIDTLLDNLPAGALAIELPSAHASTEGIAAVEGFRGDVLAWVRITGSRVDRAHLRDPSWFLWPLLEAVVEGNIVADFPLCNKSFNCSYSGHDL
jgi:Ni,Fe-hydrogenase III large subunit